jgi:hypothetical protein
MLEAGAQLCEIAPDASELPLDFRAQTLTCLGVENDPLGDGLDIVTESFSGHVEVAPGRRCRLVQFFPQAVDLAQQTVDLFSQTVDMFAQAVDLAPQTVDLFPQTVDMFAQTTNMFP